MLALVVRVFQRHLSLGRRAVRRVQARGVPFLRVISKKAVQKPSLIAVLRGFLTKSARLRAASCVAVGVIYTSFGSVVVATAPIPAAAATSPAWLTRLNDWRIASNLMGLSENTTWSQGDYNHSLYMVKDNQVTHYELSNLPNYTVAGDTAARNGNIEVSSTTSSSDSQAIDWWMGAPFHAMGMLDPRLTTTGFGAYRDSTTSPWKAGFTLDVLRGNSFTGGTFPVFFPGNGSTVPLTSYSGNESPDPLQACSGYSMPTGLPVFLELGGNVSTTVSAHSFTGNGVALAHCVIDSTNATLGSSVRGRGGVIVIPRAPLIPGVAYTVSLTVNGQAYTWSFGVNPGGSPAVAPPPPPAGPGVYTMDEFGGVHTSRGTLVAGNAMWPGWNIARAGHPWPGAGAAPSGFVLDGWGGLHPYGTAAPSETSGAPAHYWPGWDIARDFAFLPDGSGGFVLDGWGGLHAFRTNGSTAPLQAQGNQYWPGWDIARKVVIFSDGTGGYVMDAWGGLHPFGVNRAAPVTSVSQSGYWPGWNIARDIVLVPGTHSGYVLDGWGGVHQFNAAGDTAPAAITPSAYWPGWDIARGISLEAGSTTAGYTLDGWGGLHPFGGAAPVASLGYFPGQDFFRAIWET